MTTNHELAEQIEQLVRAHMEASRAAVTAAVARAFAGSAAASHREPRASEPTSNGTELLGRAASRRKAAPRRALAELTALAERFYAVVCRIPGETMTTLAPQVGASPRDLQVAVDRLKRAGRVRAVGQRQFTRYFPMASAAAAA